MKHRYFSVAIAILISLFLFSSGTKAFSMWFFSVDVSPTHQFHAQEMIVEVPSELPMSQKAVAGGISFSLNGTKIEFTLGTDPSYNGTYYVGTYNGTTYYCDPTKQVGKKDNYGQQKFFIINNLDDLNQMGTKTVIDPIPDTIILLDKNPNTITVGETNYIYESKTGNTYSKDDRGAYSCVVDGVLYLYDVDNNIVYYEWIELID